MARKKTTTRKKKGLAGKIVGTYMGSTCDGSRPGEVYPERKFFTADTVKDAVRRGGADLEFFQLTPIPPSQVRSAQIVLKRERKQEKQQELDQEITRLKRKRAKL